MWPKNEQKKTTILQSCEDKLQMAEMLTDNICQSTEKTQVKLTA